MKTEFLILADAAQVANGKLFILGGGWSLYRSAVYPAQVQLGLGISILIDWNEAGIKHPVTITMADEAGVPIIPELKGQVEAAKSTDVPTGATQRALLAVNANLLIGAPGPIFRCGDGGLLAGRGRVRRAVRRQQGRGCSSGSGSGPRKLRGNRGPRSRIARKSRAALDERADCCHDADRSLLLRLERFFDNQSIPD